MNATSPGPTDVKVSVALITYNQKAFIVQAIDSVLMQQTDFEYEIIIGDDCSTDGTRAIVTEYAALFPERIRPLLHEHNLCGQPGMDNLVETYRACRGQYIAILEGDDYWTDPHKLQKQVEFMEAHPECSMCFHNAMLVFEDGNSPPILCPWVCRNPISSIDEIIERGNFVITATVLYRNGLISTFPDWYYSLPMGDWPLHILYAIHGKLGFLDEVMAVYRVHQSGVWSGMDPVTRLTGILRAYAVFDRHFDYKYKTTIQRGVCRAYLSMAYYYLQYGQRWRACPYLLRAIALQPSILRNRRYWSQLPKTLFGK